MDAKQRAMRGRIGAYTRLSKYGADEIKDMTAAARKGFMARFDDEVDPERVLPEAERFRRAEAAKKAYFARLGLKRSQAAAKKKARKAS